jgi:Leu/Phe-tRNA-protein transferase
MAGTVAQVIVAGTYFLATTKTSTVITTAFVRGVVPSTGADHSFIWWKIVDRKLNDLSYFAAKSVLDSVLVVTAFNG